MTCACQPSPGFRLRRRGCASWSRSTTPPNPRGDTRRKRRESSHANGREDKPEEDKKALTKRLPEFPLELRAKTGFKITLVQDRLLGFENKSGSE